MSELRVALVVEGPTDAIVIQAALRAILRKPFVSTTLQPEATHPKMGTGWCGVFKWCREFSARGAQSLEQDPTLPGFDLFVVHVDADVAEKKYADGGKAIEKAARSLLPLPCSCPCPPPSAAADEVRKRLVEWLGFMKVGPRTIVCLPSKAIEAWLAAAVLPDGHALLERLECTLGLDQRLASLPKDSRFAKTPADYRKRESAVTKQWDRIRQLCTQAQQFHLDALTALACTGR